MERPKFPPGLDALDRALTSLVDRNRPAFETAIADMRRISRSMEGRYLLEVLAVVGTEYFAVRGKHLLAKYERERCRAERKRLRD